MRIYFCGSIAGGRNYIKSYRDIVIFLQSQEHVVLTEHIIAENVLENELNLTPEQIYRRDIAWLENSEVVIAEISNPSLGVGYEICYALSHHKPVLALYEENIFVSRMITGNPDRNLQIESYTSMSECRNKILAFLKLHG